LSQSALTDTGSVATTALLRPTPRSRAVKSLDFGSPFAREPDVVAYERHVPSAPDDPADVARHRAPCPISSTRLDEAFVHEVPEQLVGSVFAQAMFSLMRMRGLTQ
jgi:hypothetical protein